MLLKAEVLAEIKAGRIDIVFRHWKRSTVRAGGTLMTSAGLLAIDAVDPIRLEEVTLSEVERAGFASLEAFRGWLDTMKSGDLCRIRVRYAGEDTRLALRANGRLDAAALAEVDAALGKLDARGSWTDSVLALIAKHPGRLAKDLASTLGMEKAPFKARVRKLKDLGLTESLEVGYRLSPRGEAVRAHRTR